MLPTVRLIWWPDSQTPARSTAVVLPSCPKAVSRARSGSGIVLLSVTHFGGVQNQGEAERGKPDDHEQQSDDSEMVDNGGWIGQREVVRHVVHEHSRRERESEHEQQPAGYDSARVAEYAPPPLSGPARVIEEDVGQAAEVDALQPQHRQGQADEHPVQAERHRPDRYPAEAEWQREQQAEGEQD